MAEDKVAALTQNTQHIRWVLMATVGGLLISIGAAQFLIQHTITAIQEIVPADARERAPRESEWDQAQADMARRALEAPSASEPLRSEYKNILETFPSASDQEILEKLVDRWAVNINSHAPSLSSPLREQLQEEVQEWLKTSDAAKIRAQVAGTGQATDSPQTDSTDSDVRARPQRHIDIKSNVLAPFALGALATLSMSLSKTAFHATILLIQEHRKSTAEL